MTYQTKRQLRKALAEAEERARSNRLQGEVWEKRLYELREKVRADGWEPVHTSGGYLSIPLAGALTAPDREAEKAEVRREVLEKVIDALELSEYRKKPSLEALFAAAGTKPGVDRFWADINTALEVRAEKKRADERQATEEKVAGLAAQAAQAAQAPKAGGLSLSDITAINNAIPSAAQSVDKPKPKKGAKR